MNKNNTMVSGGVSKAGKGKSELERIGSVNTTTTGQL